MSCYQVNILLRDVHRSAALAQCCPTEPDKMLGQYDLTPGFCQESAQRGFTWYKRNGHIHTGKQNHRCKLCGRAFVRTPENPVITEEQRTFIERLLLERISPRGIGFVA